MIEILVDDSQVREMLDRLAAKVYNLEPAMREISQIMLDAVEENFARGGRPKWTPLAPATIKQRLRTRTWPGQILIRSAGGLAASIAARHDSTSASVGTNKLYGPIHQFGGKAGRGRKVTIPARPFLSLGEDEKEEIIDAMERHLRMS